MGKEKIKMREVIRIERGWGGHFILADCCLFRRNTLLQCGNVFIVVSTVGNYINPMTKKSDDLGLDRMYETMAFYSVKKDKIYHDADVEKQIFFDSKWALSKEELKKDIADLQANAMHETVVQELTEKLIKGEL